MATRFPERSALLNAAAPSFSREQIAFLEDMLINRACGPAMLNSLTHDRAADCMACAARVERLVNTIRDLGKG
ncbi:MAG: hypothetical protein P1S46_06025 [bacterium]|nr:hypothetical protein [bacterium]MDT8396357.1 hypothetical protein [bacterium]